MKKYILISVILICLFIFASYAEPFVDNSLKSMPSIFVQYPQDFYGVIGNEFYFQVEVRSDIADEVTYQWQYKTSETDIWRTSTGSSATTNRFHGNFTETNKNYLYRVRVTYGDTSYNSNEVCKYDINDFQAVDTYKQDVVILLSILTFSFIGFWVMWVIKNAKHN